MCLAAGNNFAPFRYETQFVKLTTPQKRNEEMSTEYAAIYNGTAQTSKKGALVSINNKSVSPEVVLYWKPIARRIKEFCRFILHVEGKIFTKPGSCVRSPKFRTSCPKEFTDDIECQIGDQRVGDKVEKCLRTLIESNRTKSRLDFERTNTGSLEIFSAFGNVKEIEHCAEADLQMGQKTEWFAKAMYSFNFEMWSQH